MLPHPSAEDLACILQQCRSAPLALALRLHAYVIRSGLHCSTSVGNYLVTMLADIGALRDAHHTFDVLLCRKEWSWSSLINGYLKCEMPQQALALYQDVQNVSSICPRAQTFVTLLKACGKLKNVDMGLEIHATVSRFMLLDKNLFVGSALVDMYVKCGLLGKAQQVFDKLSKKNVVLWTAIIAGYVEYGQSENAFNCFEQMQYDGVSPNAVTFICMFKACGSVGDADRGRELHCEIERLGLLESDAVVGTTIVDMYAKCGLLSIAYQVFLKFPFRNIILWNVLITGYMEYGYHKEVFDCFKQLQLEGISPDAITFICTLKVCGTIGDINEGRSIHIEIARHELLTGDPFVGNALIDMYAKCGWLSKAQQVFDKLSTKDVVSWTTLIAGYTDHGHAEEALVCFDQMQLEGFSPNAVSLICSLKACGSTRDADKGMQIHAEIEKRGLLGVDVNVGNIMVDMYARCGLLSAAHQACEKLQVQDVAAWNALIAGYVENGYGEAALKCLEYMQLKGIMVDSVTYISALKACGTIGAASSGRQLHTEIERQGLLERDHVVGNTLVDMYAKCGSLVMAQQVFDKLPIQDIVSRTSLLVGYSEHGYGAKALESFDHQQKNGFIPDAVMLVCSLKACGSTGVKVKGLEIHSEVERRGLLGWEPVIGNTLIDVYTKCGLFAMAEQMFSKLLVRDVVSWTALIASYVEQQRSNEALKCLDKMELEGIIPNAATLVCSLKACGSIGAKMKTQELHADIERRGLLNNLDVANTLVSVYAKFGLLAPAKQVFDKIVNRDVVSWNALMAGYIEAGNRGKLFLMFERMLGEGTKPNLVTFVIILSACGSMGMLTKGLFYFEVMSKGYGIVPALEHHTCMVNVLSRAGQLEKALALIMKMPFYPDHVVWDTILGACRLFGDKKFGKQAFGHLVHVDVKDSQQKLGERERERERESTEWSRCEESERERGVRDRVVVDQGEVERERETTIKQKREM